MARRVRFRPTLRKTMLGNAAFLADLAASMARSLPPEPKKRAAPRQPSGLDMDAIHGRPFVAPEAEVVRAISDLLAAHPLVLHAARQNSGMASYEASSGRYAPVYFYKLLKHASIMTLPDFWGLLKNGRFFALEAKRGDWKKPRDDRERKQANFLALVRNCGGSAGFARSVDEARIIIES